MDRREIIIGLIVFFVIVLAVLMFTGHDSAKDTQLKILNGNTIGENSTIYVKLTDGEKQSLEGKTLSVKIFDSKGKEVFSKSAKTHVTGVAIVKIHNFTDGKYTINVTYAGDENYTSSSISQNVNIKTGYVEEDLNITVNDTLDTQTTENTQTATQQSSSSSNSNVQYQTSTSDTHQQQASDDSSNDGGLIDENGRAVETVIDENGREIIPTT